MKLTTRGVHNSRTALAHVVQRSKQRGRVGDKRQPIPVKQAHYLKDCPAYPELYLASLVFRILKRLFR